MNYNRNSLSYYLPIIAIAIYFIVSDCNALRTQHLRRIRISVGDTPVISEIATTPEQRTRGLMYRTELKENEGMLFIYPDARPLAFWMKNTLIPLDVGYFDAEGFMIEYHTMQKQLNVPEASLRTYRSSEPAKYALEMNAGWYKKNSVSKYARLRLSSPVPSVQ